jgi:MYXO-CTERM domain-containing protein
MHRAKVKQLLFAFAGLLLWLSSQGAGAAAVTIEYELVALAAPGRYEYRYTVTNDSLATPVNWFSIDFDTALYDEASLTITSVGLADWSQQVLGSLQVFGVPAQYDAYKTTGLPLDIGESEAGFSIAFTWLGAGTPGTQAFTIYDAGTLDVLDSGTTVALDVPPPPPPGVPEPAAMALALTALLAAGVARRRRSAQPDTARPA